MKDKPDKPLVEKLMEEHDLNQKQAKFVLEYAKTGNGTQAHIAAGYQGTEDSHHANSSRLIGEDNVKQAYMSLLHELYPERAEDFRLTKKKVLEDLEGIKALAVGKIQEGQTTGGAYNAAVRASELQGRELGMFAQKKHLHEHEHSIVPDRDLVLSLAKDDLAMARLLGKQLGVDVDEEIGLIEGEFEVVEEKKA